MPRHLRCRPTSPRGSRRTIPRRSWPGVLTHDPGMYPKRLILDDARQFGIAILGLDVNRSDEVYRVERVGALDEPPSGILDAHRPVSGR